jgi:hypothetical protein
MFDSYLALLRASGSVETVTRQWPGMSVEAREALQMADLLYRSKVTVPPHRLGAQRLMSRLEQRKPMPFKQVFNWLTP